MEYSRVFVGTKIPQLVSCSITIYHKVLKVALFIYLKLHRRKRERFVIMSNIWVRADGAGRKTARASDRTHTVEGKFFFRFPRKELKNYELTFTFPVIFISCSQWKIVCEKEEKKGAESGRKRFSSIKWSKKTRIDENAFQDILTSKMNCLFIENTLVERKLEINGEQKGSYKL